MSLATRCTHCGTIFKVVQDQLKVSEGWVRCGRCHEVFNALPALFDLDTEAPPPRQVPGQAPQPQATVPSGAGWSPTQPAGLNAPAQVTSPAPATSTKPVPPQAPTASPRAFAPAPSSAPSPAPASPPTGAAPAAASARAAAPAPVAAPRPAFTAPASPPKPTRSAAAFGAPPQVAGAPLSAHTPLTADDLGLRPPAAATDFDLDTAVDLPGRPASGSHLDLVDDPRPWSDEPPEDLPTTDEADALESRYLLPSRDTRPVRRRERGPEFADAQFPTDLDAEDEWARYQESVPAPQTEPPPLSSLPEAVAAPEPQQPPAVNAFAGARGAAADAGDASANPAQPGDIDYVPEQPVQPPSQRRGRSGTRGRDPSSQPPEFVRKAQRQAFWRRPAVLAALGLASLVLALALALQLGHHFRDLIAAHHPAARPLLASWCAQVGCEIRPPLRLDALQVDNATLVRTASEGADRYRLTVTVHNRSEIELAWPHIDLVLTDESGTTVARRALSPTDAQVAKGEGLPLLNVPAAVPSGESTPLQWSLRLEGLSPAGYTAELFYP